MNLEDMFMPHPLPWLLASLLIVTSTVSASIPPITGINPRTTSKAFLPAKSASCSWKEALVTVYYTQTLDHYNFRPDSLITFPQRYFLNSKYWGGAITGSPIFVYLGSESPLEDQLPTVLDDYAPRFNGLLVYIEHRYYGKSIPFGTRAEAFRNTSTLGYFNSAQALADYAEVIVDLKNNLSAKSCPVIVVGGSYGGMLASWFRLKYPHIAYGALASSAPVLDFDPIITDDPYYIIVSNDFKEASRNCFDTIRQSWSVIDKVASQNMYGLSFLTQKFKSCKPIRFPYELKNYLEYMYCEAAQYDRPPTYPVNKICDAIDGVSKGTHILTKILAGVVAYKGEKSCYNINDYAPPTETDQGWGWQSCTDLISPRERYSKNTMFETAHFNLQDINETCRDTYGVTVTSRPHWIVTEFGGQDMKLALQRFGSNIIYSNGLTDPWSGTGVLQNISDNLVAIYTTKGSHCLDIQPVSEHDPDWLAQQRASEISIMEGWITEYKSIPRNRSDYGSKEARGVAISPSSILLIFAAILVLSSL